MYNINSIMKGKQMAINDAKTFSRTAKITRQININPHIMRDGTRL